MTKKTNRSILILSLLGLIVSMYLSYSKIANIPVNCSLLSGCQVVEQSEYSEIFGIPVAFLGVMFYLSLIFGTFLRTTERYAKIISKLFLLSTFFGFLFSIYLTYLELFVIFAICIYCVVSAVVSTLLFFISLYENIRDSKLQKKQNL